MSFLFGGGARPQPSSAEKIAAAEAEIEMVSNMFNQLRLPFLSSILLTLLVHPATLNHLSVLPWRHPR